MMDPCLNEASSFLESVGTMIQRTFVGDKNIEVWNIDSCNIFCSSFLVLCKAQGSWSSGFIDRYLAVQLFSSLL